MLIWAIGFVCTLALETPVYVFGLRRAVPTARAALWSLGLNLLTHPAAWALTRVWSWPRFAAVEIGVGLVEGVGLMMLLPRAASGTAPPAGVAVLAFALALTANALSAGFGLLI